MNHFLQSMKLVYKDMKIPAEKTSPCPNSLYRLWTRDGYPRSARQATALLLAIPLTVEGTRDQDLYIDLIDHILLLAERYQEQEPWQIVIKLLHNYYTKAPSTLIEQIMVTMSVNDWYGNMIPEIRRAIRSLKWQRVDYSVVSDTRPVTYPKRKRGYDDKGSYQRDPWPRIPMPEKEKKKLTITEPPRWKLWFRFSRKGR